MMAGDESVQTFADDFAVTYSFDPSWIPVIIDIATILLRECAKDHNMEGVLANARNERRRSRQVRVVTRRVLSREQWNEHGEDLCNCILDWSKDQDRVSKIAGMVIAA